MIKVSSSIVPSAPSKVEKMRMQLWDTPYPSNRQQYLERKDLQRQLKQAERDERYTVEKAGYGTLMKIRGQMGGNDNGM